MLCNHKSYLRRLLSIIMTFCFLFSLSVIVASADTTGESGTTYYISDSLGNDENNGTSEATPWKTIERLSQVSLTAGDKVLFKSGDIWYGSWTLDLSNGDKENPIVFSSYGEGNKPGLRLYTGKVTPATSGICLTLNNPNGFVMDGLAIGYANLGIRLYYDADHYESDYVCFTNCHFHDIYGVTQYDNNPDIYVSAGITTVLEDMDRFQKEGDDQGNNWALRGLYIDNCTAYDAGTLVCGPAGVFDFYMTDCIAENNGYYGTTVFGCRNGYMERCVFKNNGSRSMPAGSCGIMISCQDFTVRNTIIAGQQRQDNDPDGCGIDFEWTCNNVTIEHCLFQENAGVGVMYFTSGAGAAGTNHNTHIYDCYFVNNNTNIGNVGGFDIFSTTYGAADCIVSGNKYIVTDMYLSETIDFSMCLENNDLVFENNIELKEIPDNLESMILNAESTSEPKNQTGHNSQVILYCGISAVIAIAISLCFWFIMKFARKKRYS